MQLSHLGVAGDGAQVKKPREKRENRGRSGLACGSVYVSHRPDLEGGTNTRIGLLVSPKNRCSYLYKRDRKQQETKTQAQFRGILREIERERKKKEKRKKDKPGCCSSWASFDEIIF